MTEFRDMDTGMSYSTTRDDLAEHLFGGQAGPETIPSEYRPVAALLEAVRGPAVESELASEADVVGAAVAAVRATLPVTPLHDPARPARPARRRRIPGRLTAAAAAGAVILGGTAAAAATDSLPGPAQTAVSDALSHVGISVPKPNGHANKHALASPGHSGTAPGHSGSAPGHQGSQGSGPSVQPGSPAEFGLCTAFLSGSQGGTSGNRNSSTALAKLMAAHGGSVASTTTYCKGVVAAHPGGSQSQGTDDQEGNAPSGSGPPPGGTQVPGGGAPAHSGKPGTTGPPAGAGNSSSAGSSSSPGANGAGGGNGAGHAPAPTNTPTSTGASTSSTINGHSKVGSAHG